MIWNCEFTIGLMTRAVLIDSVTERPLPLPCFEDEFAAGGFLAYAAACGISDVRALNGAELEALHGRWCDEGAYRLDEDEDDQAEGSPC
jgi:hypothetical protein